MSRLLTIPAGRVAKFVVVVVWLALAAIAAPFGNKFESVQKNDPGSYLPGDAESVEVLEQSERFGSGKVTPAIVVYRREGGLTGSDRRKIRGDVAAFTAEKPAGVTDVPDAPVPSEDGRAALLVLAVVAEGEEGVLGDAVEAIRDQVGEGEGGLDVEVSGPAGFSADAIAVFEQINGTLLGATAAIVFLLLILIYRSPIFWIVPLVSVGLAEFLSRGIGYGIAEAGVTVNGQSAGILAVLVFGAGTDYALLLVARYREELRHHEDRHEAMRIALRRAGPAIVASGLTVIAALLCLSLAEVNGTAGLGPIGAIGVGLAMLSMLTLLPALLLIVGRRAFWPFVPRFGAEGADETHGAWRQVADRVAARPRRVLAGGLLLLGVMSLGLVYANNGLTSGNGFREDVDAKEGQALIAQSFPAGANAPTTVIVPDRARVPAVVEALEGEPSVAEAAAVEEGPPGARVEVALDSDPYSDAAFAAIPGLRRAAKEAGGEAVLVGGPTAEERDLRTSAARDNRVIVPIVLLAVFLILSGVLRALVAPLILMATVLVSYAAALGVAYFFFDRVFGFAGADPALPLFAFIFLIALGVDYNIFLMARVREEAHSHGTRHGMVRGLAVTGAVITSAGIVLAGTFSVLAVLPLVALTEIGFTIAFGVLLDTFIVRSILVPALVMEIGPKVWWPSGLAKEPH